MAEAADGDTALARDMLQKATTVQPGSVPCWHAWAKLELTAGNADKARELYLKALALNPKETVTHSKSLAVQLLFRTSIVHIFRNKQAARLYRPLSL